MEELVRLQDGPLTMAQDWNIEKGRKACAKCETAFRSEEVYMSALFEAGETFERRNFCQRCWEAGIDGVFSYWKTQAARKDEKRDDRQTLVDLFDNMMTATELDGQRLKMAFLISMSLVRKRLLRLEPSIHRDGREFLVLLRTADQRQFTLPHPEITEEELQPLHEELCKLLGIEV